MKPILYPVSETQFRNNGLGRLSDAVKCLVTEERNGQYELELQYPITGIHYTDIVEERIIAARHDDSDDIQPFRIYKITRPMNGIVTVNARHISYQLSKVVVMPFTAGSCQGALAGLVRNSVGDCPFNIWTDKLVNADFSVEQPSSFSALLGVFLDLSWMCLAQESMSGTGLRSSSMLIEDQSRMYTFVTERI